MTLFDDNTTQETASSAKRRWQAAPASSVQDKIEKADIDKVLCIVLQHAGGNCLLDWKDATCLGAVNKQCHKTFVSSQDSILAPVLAYLEEMAATNKTRRIQVTIFCTPTL